MSQYDQAFAGVDATSIGRLQSLTTLDSDRPRLSTTQTAINNRETSELNTALTTANNSANTMLVYGGLLSRNAVLNTIAQDMTTQNKRVAQGGASTFSRQSEINEWQAQNKMDTLFFLQVLFLYFAVVVICLYIRQIGMLPNAVFYMIVGLGLIIVLGILWNRASYTKISRDKRHWNRRFIGLGDSGDLAAKLQCSLSA